MSKFILKSNPYFFCFGGRTLTENALIPPASHLNVTFFPGHIGLSADFRIISDVVGASGGAGQISLSAKLSAGSMVRSRDSC